MTSNIVKYVPFSSSVDPSFWTHFVNLKLNELHLSTESLPVRGYYSHKSSPGLPPILGLQFDSFNQNGNDHPDEIVAIGKLYHTNTIDDYKKINKSELQSSFAKDTWEAIVSGEAFANPSILSSFLIFIFADLKKYHFYYWFSFPAFSLPVEVTLKSVPKTLYEELNDDELINKIEIAYKNRNSDVHPGYFVMVIGEEYVKILPLKIYQTEMSTAEKENKKVWLGFSDPSTSPHHPGWPLRNLMVLIRVAWSSLNNHTVLCLRERIVNGVSSVKESLVLNITSAAVDLSIYAESPPNVVGWELNDQKKLAPRFINLKSNMDPLRIAETAVELNLKLMRWRIVPQLDLVGIRNTRCLLFGAGTLGCNVARCLLGWGVENITFIDNGRVSRSNPVRQSLFTFEDANGEGGLKAKVAAENLKKIYPAVISTGHVITIPMPGHPVSSNEEKQVTENINHLIDLINDHDVLFLLTDSRESRWLPTLLGAVHNKIVLTSALGFDSFLVMRHGLRASDCSTNSFSDLGCYFCNDVVAPANSLVDRTLDEQCTVTRPGMSFMAAGHVTEMLMSLLQHPLKAGAPSCESSEDAEGVLGLVPHSVRYFLGRLHHLNTSTPSFKNCSACSEQIRSAYTREGNQFLFNVFKSPSYLEEISGLSQLQQLSELAELREISDTEEESL